MINKADHTAEEKEPSQRSECDPVDKSGARLINLLNEKKLLHELQANQIKMKLQNESLLAARTMAEEAQERNTYLFDFAPIAYFSIASNAMIQQANIRGASLLCMDRATLTGLNFKNFVFDQDRSIFVDFLETVFSNNLYHHCELRLQIGEAQFYVTIEAMGNRSGRSCLAAITDITERKRNQEELQLAANIYLALGEAIMVTDENNRIVAINPAFSLLTGYPANEIVGQRTSLLKSKSQHKTLLRDISESLSSYGRWDGEITLHGKNGEIQRWLTINSIFDNNGRVMRRVSMFSDITEKRRVEARVRKQANIDPLTELPNRRLFLDRLQQAIHKSHREQQRFALMFLDLDHFKQVNDLLGHDIGDTLLKQVSVRLKTCIRETDTLARLGGDEFTIIVLNLEDSNSVERIVQCIQSRMLIPFHIDGKELRISFSIGIAIHPEDSEDMESLLKSADKAMYCAKHQGRNRFCYFSSVNSDML